MSDLLEDFLLLAYDESGRNTFGSMQLDFGLAGAALVTLALADRVDVADKKLVVRDATPTGEPVCDSVLAELVEARTPKKVEQWVQPLAKGLRTQVLNRLVARGVLKLEQEKVLWIFPVDRYPSPTGTEPAAETELRARMRQALNSTGPLDTATAAVIGLVRATGMEKQVFGKDEAKARRARLEEIANGNWAAPAVRKAIEQVQAATMMAVTAAIAASSVAASSS